MYLVKPQPGHTVADPKNGRNIPVDGIKIAAETPYFARLKQVGAVTVEEFNPDSQAPATASATTAKKSEKKEA
jgi:hypothetical protein